MEKALRRLLDLDGMMHGLSDLTTRSDSFAVQSDVTCQHEAGITPGGSLRMLSELECRN
ncbi:TPA: hypothetical protein NPP25_004778 [Klebsiella quasipneumoniae subsp. similipneumoniae]|nr:hypothetical protein [Klebsiella quasipneumoniae subsp. similipneumoniae]